jgi:hypothetical protein
MAKKMGRKEFAVTAERKRMVQIGAANSVPLNVLSMMLGCSEATLKKHFREEWEHGFQVIKGRITLAVTRKALRGDIPAARLWLGARCPDWRPGENRFIAGIDDAPPIALAPGDPSVVIILPSNGRELTDTAAQVVMREEAEAEAEED